MSNLTVENVYTRHTAKLLTQMHFWKLLAMMLTVVGIIFAASLACAALAGGLATAFQSAALSAILSLVPALVIGLAGSGLGLGLTAAMLYVARNGQHPKVGQVFSRMGQCVKAFGLSLWVSLKTMLWVLPGYVVLFFVTGFILVAGDPHHMEATAVTDRLLVTLLPVLILILIFALVIPAALRYMLSLYVLADNPEMSVFNCVRQSKALMKGHKWQAFKLMVPIMLLMALAEFFIALAYTAMTAILGGTTLANILSVALLIAWAVLSLYLAVRMHLGYCIFYTKRLAEQQAPQAE